MESRESTTYVLGAGASLHAGYPFAKSMGAHLLAWMRLPREEAWFNFAATADFVEAQFGDHIEHIFNGVQAQIDSKGPGHTLLANVHKPCLLEAMRQWFAEIHQQQHAPAYQRFAFEIVKPGDTIITFNYDVSLDSRLHESGTWSIGDGYGFAVDGLPSGSTVKILKLHGSINWLAILFSGVINGSFALPRAGAFGSRPVFGSNDLTALGYEGLRDPHFTGPAAAVPPLILPTSRKTFFFQTSLGREWEGFWRRLWNGAKRKIEASSKVVVCGYGMYPIDRRGSNLLLRSSIRADIEVCCGSDSGRIVKKLQDAGHKAHQASHTYFEQWVGSQ